MFGPEYTRNMSRLFEVRNAVIHCISLDEVNYFPKNKISLSDVSSFNKFVDDFQDAWKKLLEIYVKEQKELDWKKLSEFL